jgi:hypothetical protein
MTDTDLTCPYCSAPNAAEDQATWHRCTQCNRIFSAAAQRAYARGMEHLADAEGGDLTPIDPRRPRPRRESGDMATLQSYQQAHSALELAFQSDLPEEQRHEGLLAMAEVAQVLARRDLLAPLEAHYWVKVLMEHNTRRERADLEARLAEPGGGSLRRLRWRLRRDQLRRALDKLDREIADLEETIAFVEPPHARDGREDRQD